MQELDSETEYYEMAKALIEDQMDAAEGLARQLGYSHIDVGKPYREMISRLAKDCGKSDGE